MESLGADIEGHQHFVIENSQKDSQYMKDRIKKVNEYATFLEVDGITIHVILNKTKEKVDYDRRK